MQCPRCGQPSREGIRFCGACGSPLAPPAGDGTTVALAAGQQVAPAQVGLVVRAPGMKEQIALLTGPSVRVGGGEDCDLRLSDPAFAGLAVEVAAYKGDYLARDLHAAHGLVAEGVKVNRAVLSTRDPVYAPNALGQAVSFLLRPLARGAVDRHGADHALSVRFRPGADTLTIGRDPDNDLVVDYPLVSRFHARIERLAQHVLLHDLGSTNGTFARGVRVRGLCELHVGDEVQIGPLRFTFQGDALEQVDDQPGVRIDAVDLVRRAGRRGGPVLLDRVGVSVLPREFVALIGGSGSGKSTLLHALAGVAPPQAGAVLYNGQDIYRRSTPYAGLIGYVPQDDILHRDLTVGRALAYAARLRLPPDTAAAERERRIAAVLADVQMEPQRHQAISRLSGGQRKRVSIAVELLANPSVLFLDEPTSGLDPGLDKAVMHLLRHLCEEGRTVVLVTHATENIGQCDLVAFLAGGRLVYYGPPDVAPDFFGVEGFPDIYTLLADPEEAGTRELRFRQSGLYRTHVLERQEGSAGALVPHDAPSRPVRRVRAAAFRQWGILSTRYAELVRRDRVNLGLLLAQTPIVATALTLVTSRELYTGPKINNTQQVLLMLSIVTLWFGTTNAAREIVKERPVYLRERLVNLRLFPYILSKVGVLAALGLAQVVALFAIVSLKTPYLPARGILLPAPLEMVTTLALCALAGLFGGLLISSLVRTTDRAMSIVPIVLIPQVVFSGAVFDLTGWAKPLSYLTVSHWCLAALCSTVRLNDMASRVAVNGQAVTLVRPDTPLPDVIANWPKEMYSSPDGVHLLGYWGALLLFCVLCLLGTYVALRRSDVGISKRAADGPGRRTWLLLTVPPVLLCSVALLIGGLHASGQTLPRGQATPGAGAHRLPPQAMLAPGGGGTSAAALFVEPAAGRRPVLAAIGAARRTLDVAMYLFTDGILQRALIEAQGRGVRVRVLLEPRPVGREDAATGNRDAFAALGRGGVSVRWATTPARLLHEKALVADGRQALLLTLNFTRAAFATNRDFGVIDGDPRDVRETEALFAADWRGADFAPSNPDLIISPVNSRARIPALIGRAQRTVDLWTEYLRDAEIQRSIAEAVRRGVRVRAILAATAANRQVQNELAGSGVQVALVTRPVVHAKAIVIDGRLALVGSQNLTTASLDRNREEGVLLANPAVVNQLEATFRLDWPVPAG